MLIYENALDDLPRERLSRLGVTRLSDSELVALTLRSGSRGMPVAELADKLVQPGLERLAKSSLDELSSQPGVGPAKAASLLAGLELGRRLTAASGPPITTPEEAYLWLRDMGDLRKEVFRALHLDGRRRLLRVDNVSVGTLTATLVHPREVFQPALEVGAASMVVAHNHPSGDPNPSAEDYQLTRRLVDAGDLLGIEVLDHLIVGKGRFLSLRQSGYSWKPAGKQPVR